MKSHGIRLNASYHNYFSSTIVLQRCGIRSPIENSIIPSFKCTYYIEKYVLNVF